MAERGFFASLSNASQKEGSGSPCKNETYHRSTPQAEKTVNNSILWFFRKIQHTIFCFDQRLSRTARTLPRFIIFAVTRLKANQRIIIRVPPAILHLPADKHSICPTAPQIKADAAKQRQASQKYENGNQQAKPYHFKCAHKETRRLMAKNGTHAAGTMLTHSGKLAVPVRAAF